MIFHEIIVVAPGELQSQEAKKDTFINPVG